MGSRPVLVCLRQQSQEGSAPGLRRGRRQRGRAAAGGPAAPVGRQAQFIEAPVAPEPDDDRMVASMQWALSNLDADITVAVLARRAHMSTRSYLRHFRRCTGTSPIRWPIDRRVQASLPLLETGDASVEEIAAATGFGSATTYRYHFARVMRTSPTAYRRAFRASGAVAASVAWAGSMQPST